MTKLTEDQARQFAYEEDNDEYEYVETIKFLDDLYKDSCPAQTVLKKLDDGSFWAFDWSSYQSYYGSGENSFYDCELYPVEQKEQVSITKYWAKI